MGIKKGRGRDKANEPQGILVFSEDEKSFIYYLKGWLKEKGITSVTIEHLKQKMKRLEKLASAHKKVYCVFDVEEIMRSNKEEAQAHNDSNQHYQSKRWRCVRSSPMYEVWLLFHFKPIGTSATYFAAKVNELLKKHVPSYEDEMEGKRDESIYEKVKGNESLAFKRVEIISKALQEDKKCCDEGFIKAHAAKDFPFNYTEIPWMLREIETMNSG